jgi:drug/metabolite transporter (DMT)-like permease
MKLLPILLGLASATCFAVSFVLEQRAAKQERPTRTIDPRLLLRLLRRPMWLFGWLLDALGTGLQALALRFGPIALVEPLLVSGLFIAIPLEAALQRRRPHRRDVLVVVLGVVGLVGFLAAANPQAGVTQPSTAAWLGVAVAIGLLCAICLVVAWRTRDATRGLMLGIATGLLFAMAAALLKTVTSKIPEHPASILTDWHLYALVLVGGTALALSQNALQSGPIAAPLTAITLLDPFASVVIGVTAFRENLSLQGPRLVIGLVAVAAMSIGIWMSHRTRSS